MKLETVEETDEVLHVRLEDANPAVANTLRRSMMTKVPTMAVQELRVNQNQSGLFDEMLANRVGQIPLTIPEGFDEDDTAVLALDREGETKVTAEDLSSGNYDIEPVNNTTIVKLKEGQALEFEADAELGHGTEHAKHQGGTVGYEEVDENTFEFRVESTSSYSNRELVQEGLEQVHSRLEELKNDIQQ